MFENANRNIDITVEDLLLFGTYVPVQGNTELEKTVAIKIPTLVGSINGKAVNQKNGQQIAIYNPTTKAVDIISVENIVSGEAEHISTSVTDYITMEKWKTFFNDVITSKDKKLCVNCLQRQISYNYGHPDYRQYRPGYLSDRSHQIFTPCMEAAVEDIQFVLKHVKDFDQPKLALKCSVLHFARVQEWYNQLTDEQREKFDAMQEYTQSMTQQRAMSFNELVPRVDFSHGEKNKLILDQQIVKMLQREHT